ncbi:uncharacterized protein K441DRAFT_681744 [Cenococcum geophilum 1.58]|uniref:uncharacterized protein n=1 Tax=Cenococcum geophilum 1.58 TaxID=794803 RepID=UPI0035900230|nr:hypothetical protein K441DRAFT_681744 [Cenococcum geophilum 1.58]
MERRISEPTIICNGPTEGCSAAASSGQKRKRASSAVPSDRRSVASLSAAAAQCFLKSAPKVAAKDLFLTIDHNNNKAAPGPNDDWGTHPRAIPHDHVCSPPARSSDAAVIPALFGNRSPRFVAGQSQKIDGKIVNQAGNLTIPLADMRIDKNTGLPRRTTHNDKCSTKIRNDRRRKAINRVTYDVPWEQKEREYIVELLQGKPDTSMREIAERFNYRFWSDFIGGGFCGHPLVEVQVDRVGLDELRCGRTLECIRAEYLEHKVEYDAGIVPGMKKANIKEGVKREISDKQNQAKPEKTSDVKEGSDVPQTLKAPKLMKLKTTNFLTSFTPEEHGRIAEIVTGMPNSTMADLSKQFDEKCKEIDDTNSVKRRKNRRVPQIKEDFNHFEGLYRKGITPGSSGFEAFVKDPSESKLWYELSEDEDMYADEDEEL